MADNIGGEPQLAALIAKAATFAPGFAGAVLSLAFIDKLTVRGRVLTVIVGLCCAVWIAPAAADLADLFWPGAMPPSVRNAIQFLTALVGMGAIPPFLDFVKRFAGDPLGLLKVRFGG